MTNGKLLLSILIILAAIGFAAVWQGYYPIAFVGWRPILAKSFDENYAVALNFYRNQINNAEIFNSSATQEEIKSAVLTNLIEDKIIENEIIKKIGKEEFEKRIAEKLKGVDLSSDKTKEGAKLIYGLSTEQLKEILLTEQAKREIAKNLFGSSDKDLSDWLGEKIRSSKITVLMSVKVFD